MDVVDINLFWFYCYFTCTSLDMKLNLRPFRAANILMRKGMGHTAVSATLTFSVTLFSWQLGAKENFCILATFNHCNVTTFLRSFFRPKIKKK